MTLTLLDWFHVCVAVAVLGVCVDTIVRLERASASWFVRSARAIASIIAIGAAGVVVDVWAGRAPTSTASGLVVEIGIGALAVWRILTHRTRRSLEELRDAVREVRW